MKKSTFTILAIAILIFTGCKDNDSLKKSEILQALNEASINGLSLEQQNTKISESISMNSTHKDQIQDSNYYKLGDMEFIFVLRPDSYNELPTVKAWEQEGNKVWSGVLIKKGDSAWTEFLNLNDSDEKNAPLNPVGILFREEDIAIDVRIDNENNSEDFVIRYVYQFNNVSKEILGTWSREACSYNYILEEYTPKDLTHECARN